MNIEKNDKFSLFIVFFIILMVTILIGIGIGMVSYDKLKGIEHNECIRLYDICTEKYNDCNLARTGTIQGVIYNGTQEFSRTVERDYIPTPD